jgi:DUF2971 family protein
VGLNLGDWSGADRALDAVKEKVASMISNDLRGAEDNIDYQPTIYHYTDVKGALGILKTGHLWFTERSHLNDPVEIRYGLEIAHELFETAAKNRGAKIPREAASHLKGEHTFGLSTYGFWISSFSLDGNDLNQWRNYADDGRGVCLGFSTAIFDMNELAKPVASAPNRLRFPVNYNKDHLQRKMQAYIDLGLDLLEQVNLPERDSYYESYGRALLFERDFLRVLNDGFYVNSLLSKHAAYSHEQEYRLLVSGFQNTIASSDRHRLRERKGEIVGYLDLPIPSWKQPRALTQIRLGPAAPNQLNDQLRTTLTMLGIPVPKIDQSDIPYRSTR